ncbi:universal stress protein [Halorubrum sp. 48-1-W]|uniref:universal stress protein n=1 Tax=Halorubrum sp. 48-1-W TaxID=2249761 RepID=UPI000DCBA76E|nr:universal stress protein [Halorubrum sp. 48-1-W]RAW45469.1 universal stress protein [Halorubrum sp. 48-1-W]
MKGSDADVDDADAGGGETDSPVDTGPGTETPAVGEPVVEPAVATAAADVPTAGDVALNGLDRATRPDRVSSVLVAVGPGPHSGATVDVGRRLAEATDAWLELFHVVPSEEALTAGGAREVDGDAGNEDGDYETAGERLLDAARDRLGAFDRVDRWLVEDRTAAGAIVEQSPYYDLVVLGAPTTGAVGRFVFGSTTDTVVDEAAVPVVVVEAADEQPLE